MVRSVGSPAVARRTAARGSCGGCVPALRAAAWRPAAPRSAGLPAPSNIVPCLVAAGCDRSRPDRARGSTRGAPDKAATGLIGTRLARCCLNLKRAHVLAVLFPAAAAWRRGLAARAGQRSQARDLPAVRLILGAAGQPLDTLSRRASCRGGCLPSPITLASRPIGNELFTGSRTIPGGSCFHLAAGCPEATQRAPQALAGAAIPAAVRGVTACITDPTVLLLNVPHKMPRYPKR